MGVLLEPSCGKFILTHPNIKVVHMHVFVDYSITAALFFQFCEVGGPLNFIFLLVWQNNKPITL
jgi:hypothetical protein